MAEKVKIATTAGGYAITQDGRRLKIIGDIMPQQYAYTDGVVCYGYGTPDNRINKKPVKFGGMPVFCKVFSSFMEELKFTDEKLKPLYSRGYYVTPNLDGQGPDAYNTDKRAYCLYDIIDTGNTDTISKYKNDKGKDCIFTGIFLRWRGDYPDMQTGEYLRNDSYNSITEWSVSVDPQTQQLVYTPNVIPASGWIISGESPLPAGTSNNLSINTYDENNASYVADTVNLNGIFNTVKQHLDNRHGVSNPVPGIIRPNASLGKFALYPDDSLTGTYSALYADRRMQWDGSKAIFNFKVCGICYPETAGHPLDPNDPTAGDGWWPLELYYKGRAVYENNNNNNNNGTLRIIYLVEVENGNERIITHNSGYVWNVDGWEWDSLTGELSKDNEIIYTGNVKPIAVTEAKNMLFSDRIKPPNGSALTEILVDNDNANLINIDDWHKVYRAIRAANRAS